MINGLGGSFSVTECKILHRDLITLDFKEKRRIDVIYLEWCVIGSGGFISKEEIWTNQKKD